MTEITVTVAADGPGRSAVAEIVLAALRSVGFRTTVTDKEPDPPFLKLPKLVMDTIVHIQTQSSSKAMAPAPAPALIPSETMKKIAGLEAAIEALQASRVVAMAPAVPPTPVVGALTEAQASVPDEELK